MNSSKRASQECNDENAAKKKSNMNHSLLCQAVQDNDANQCRELLEKYKIDVNEKCPYDGTTALHQASKCNNTDIMTLLLDSGADMNVKNEYGYTPLHVCSKHNREEAAKLLLENGADTNAQNANKNAPLHLAARYDSLEVCKVLLEEGDSDINAKGINDCTPLHLAVEHDCMKTCQELLSQQANVDALRKGERTPLHDAASKSVGDKYCRILLEYGADINAADSHGKTALQICCEILNNLPQKVSKINKAGYRRILTDLLTYGADPHKENLHGLSCFASYENNQEIKQCLQEAKELSLSRKWDKSNPKSEKHASVLSKVVKGQNSKRVSCYEYYNKPIGSGAFGHVYAGISVKDGREVAIKRIDMTMLPTAEHRREIKNLIRLRGCQNIVNYIDFDHEKGNIYVVLELMEGTIGDLLDDPALKGANIIKMCNDVINALHFLHSKNIIHRDIKPNNILYTTDKRVILKLADLGLSTRVEKETSTVMHSVAGTRCWMAPEVLESLDHSKSSDVFSSGLVLYYLLVPKQHAFAPESVSQSISSKLKTEHVITDNILNHRVNISACKQPEARHLIEKMLCNSKENRPSAQEVLYHPFFWTDKKKIDFILATANQPDVCKPSGSCFEKDLESSLGIYFRTKDWSGWSPSLGNIYNEMLKSGRRCYKTSSAIHLLRFIRNAYQHASDGSHTELFMKQAFDEFLFLKEFEFLIIEVYKVVKKHNWDIDCKEIRNVILSLEQC